MSSPGTQRPSSRSSGRSISIRAPSPALSLDDPVAVRNQISTLKHNIRHQQAQVSELETITHIRSSLSSMASASSSSLNLSLGSPPPPPSSYTSARSPTPTSKATRRTSYEVLQGIAGPDSGLPLPVNGHGRTNGGGNSLDEINVNGIREGVPMMMSPTAYKRLSSPTRTLSRIPVASVGNARALADEGALSPNTATSPSPSSPSGLQAPPSPTPNPRRASLTPGGTTKVLADLQTGVINARNALENTKAQLRLSQRSVATLTRQTEDLKEGRERLRLENEGLNNVVARKERLLQEVLERARKAESEATLLRSQLKSESSQSKKSLREMESALSESTALSQKSEREYVTLRESIKHLTESWKSDTDRLRDEIRKREEKWKSEAEVMGKKYRRLVEEVQASRSGQEDVKKAREEDTERAKQIESRWLEEIERIKQAVEKSDKEGEETAETARQLAAELARLRRLMQNSGRPISDSPPNP